MRTVRLLSSNGSVTAMGAADSASARHGDVLSAFDARRLVWELSRSQERSTLVELYALAGDLEPFVPAQMADVDLASIVDDRVEAGRIVFVRGWDGAPAGLDGAAGNRASQEAADLARKVTGEGGELAFEGHRYRFGVGGQEARGFAPLRAIQASRLVRRMAATIPATPAERATWIGVVALVDAGGLQLLRNKPRPTAIASAAEEVATTPSAFKRQVAPEHWIEIEILFEDGTPFTGTCVVELPDGRQTEGPPDSSGIVRIDGLTPGSCHLTFPDLDAGAFDLG